MIRTPSKMPQDGLGRIDLPGGPEGPPELSRSKQQGILVGGQTLEKPVRTGFEGFPTP